jgi:hypothetical protein
MIDYSYISVVIQGPIIHANNLTKRVIHSVRQTLLGAEIILSTWENENTLGLDADVVLKNIDPNNFKINESLFNNVNRLIISTKTGIIASKGKHILKLRSDILINNTTFIRYFNQYSEYQEGVNYKLFNNKVLGLQYYFRDPLKSNYLFHISDIMLFGNKVDIFSIFDCDLAKKEDLINHTNSTKVKKIMRNSPEQYLWICFLNKQGIPVKINFLDDIGYRNFILSELTILNNFIIIDQDKLKIDLPSRMHNNSISNLYTFRFWNFNRFLGNNLSLVLTSIRYFISQIKWYFSNKLCT